MKLTRLYSLYIIITIASEGTSFIVTLLPSAIDVVENGSENLTCYSPDFSGRITSSGWKYSGHRASPVIYILDNTCNARGFIYENPALYAWSCPEDNKFVLTLLNVNVSSHQNTWTCDMKFKESNSVETLVKVPVKSVEMKSHTGGTVTVKETAVTRFVCQTTCSRPEPKVFWFLRSSDERIINVTSESRQSSSACGKAGFTEVTSVLSYAFNRTFQGWNIYCLAANIPGRNVTSSRKSLNVLFPPDGPPVITGTPNGSKYRVVEHEKATLSCAVSGGNPLAKLVWLCFNGDVSEIKDTDTVASTVTWSALRNQHHKSCVCVAEHMFGNSYTSVTVEIMYKASVLQFYIGESTDKNSFTVSEDENVIFSCSIEGNTPPNATLSHNGRITHVSVSSNSLGYTKKHIQCYDAGLYICTAMNEYDNGKPSGRNITLYVNCSPRPFPFFDMTENVKSSIYTSAALKFTALAFPEPGFTWYYLNGSQQVMLTDSQNLEIISFSSQSVMTIRNVTQSDYGQYFLLIINSFGVYEQNYSIEPKNTYDFTTVISVSTTVPNMVANTSSTVAFVAVGVGTFVATLILFGSALFVYRFMGRRWERLHNVHKTHRQHTEKPLSATDGMNEVAEYEQIAMKSAETRTSVSDKRESVTSDEPTKQYEILDESRKETSQYSQLPALYEQMQTSRENTESGSIDIKEPHHAMKDYINIRI